ncbi:hypothetical protein [Roseiconus lacunae]|uniref:Uncharacterized protein n=1 Tax=Roseiconus lacunae TaxID=2605694 RepID=A0ABT7PS29_9BACT|nr:hypothetical protein [Roseiconus lacunae]MDM4019084.1 hypothetical protein [Roseiconus lacunae]
MIHRTHYARQDSPRSAAHRNKRRSGTITLCVLACMAIVVSLCMTLLHSANRSRQETKLRHQMEQTERFLDAAILRAVTRRRADEQYKTETWRTELMFQGRAIAATAEIKVDESLEVTVQARLGSLPQQTQQSYQFQLRLEDES